MEDNENLSAEELIEKGELVEAQSILDKINEKSGRKHFVQSKLFERKGWYGEQRGKPGMRKPIRTA